MRLRRLCLEIFDFRRFFNEPIEIGAPIQASHLRKRNLVLAFHERTLLSFQHENQHSHYAEQETH